jgi:hypothetical protein
MMSVCCCGWGVAAAPGWGLVNGRQRRTGRRRLIGLGLGDQAAPTMGGKVTLVTGPSVGATTGADAWSMRERDVDAGARKTWLNPMEI